MHASGLKRFTVAILLASCAGAALAQYVWLNEQGVKQYSDTPPPASVPNSKILKTPRGSVPASAPAKAAEEKIAEDDNAKKEKGPQTTAEKNADYNKRMLEKADKDKEAEQKAKLAADKKKGCEQASNYKRVLDSGERISRMDPSGERSYMSDEERAQETRNNNRVMDECK
jgi:type IV secretory pathway VirB10-like protein